MSLFIVYLIHKNKVIENGRLSDILSLPHLTIFQSSPDVFLMSNIYLTPLNWSLSMYSVKHTRGTLLGP